MNTRMLAALTGLAAITGDSWMPPTTNDPLFWRPERKARPHSEKRRNQRKAQRTARRIMRRNRK